MEVTSEYKLFEMVFQNSRVNYHSWTLCYLIFRKLIDLINNDKIFKECITLSICEKLGKLRVEDDFAYKLHVFPERKLEKKEKTWFHRILEIF